MRGLQLLVGDQGRWLTWIRGGGFPLTKHCFDTGNGIQLGFAGDCREILEGAFEDG